MLRLFSTLLFLGTFTFGFTQITVKEGTLPINTNVRTDSMTVINGTAPGAQGKTIRLSAPGDLITFLDKPLASAPIGPDGKFTLTLKVETTMVAILSINFHKAEIFIEPSKTQRVLIDSINYNDGQEINPFIQSQSLKLQILFEDPYDLNFIIGEFNGIYNTFLLDNFNALYRDRDKSKVDTFRIQTNTRFVGAENDYFKGYTGYKIASLEQLTRYYSAPELARRYFIGKPILYKNLEYMDFFNSYFSKYITVTSKVLHLVDYKSILKGADPCAVMMKTLATDTLLRNEQLRELVLLKGTMEMNSMPEYRQEDILAVIKAVAERSKYTENRTIAENMVTVLTKLKPGTVAPAFSLSNRYKNTISLKDFQGKGVVLCFWTTYCQGCLSEMDLIRPLYDKYKSKVEFISISADADFNKMMMFISMKKDFVWNFLHIGDQSEVLSNYDVRSYPLFVLIDKTGKIYKYPAEQPGSGLDAAIEMMIQE